MLVNNSTFDVSKQFCIRNNVNLKVIDRATGKVVQEHEGHNTATNTLLTGIGHYLVGDGVLRQGYSMLSRFVPKYISLGTMGLCSQEEDLEGLPIGICGFANLEAYTQEIYEAKAAIESAVLELQEKKCPCYDYGCCDTCQNPEMKALMEQLEQNIRDAVESYNQIIEEAKGEDDEVAFSDYMNQRPGFGADGYSSSMNNDRPYMGLGPAYTSFSIDKSYKLGDICYYKGRAYRATEDMIVNPDVGIYNMWNTDKWEEISEEDQPVCFELITTSHPRELISFREVLPESDSEIPGTIDVVFSAMISTNSLSQFMENGKSYIFISEAGLWSDLEYQPDSVGYNGLLAGYRLAPPNPKNWGMKPSDVTDEVAIQYLEEHGVVDPTSEQVEEIKPVVAEENRNILKKQILKVKTNQVVQVTWKIQLGTMDQFMV